MEPLPKHVEKELRRQQYSYDLDLYYARVIQFHLEAARYAADHELRRIASLPEYQAAG